MVDIHTTSRRTGENIPANMQLRHLPIYTLQLDIQSYRDPRHGHANDRTRRWRTHILPKTKFFSWHTQA